MGWRWGLITARAKADWHARRLSRALSQTGAVEVIDPADLRLLCGRTAGRDVLMVLAGGHDARRFDGIVVGRLADTRADIDLQLDAVRALDFLEVPCVNRVGPMLSAQDKLWTAAVLANAGIPTPLCSSVPTRTEVIQATAEIGDAVAKPIFGSLGDGLFRCHSRRERERLAHVVGQEPFLVQRFVPPGGTDYRLFVVGDRVEACVRRDAPEGEWRTNIARGARAVEAVPHRLWRDIAVSAAQVLGLELAGVDLAVGDEGPTVIEINGFPNFRGVYEATGRDMAPAIATRVLKLAKAPRRPRLAGPRIAGRVPGRLRA